MEHPKQLGKFAITGVIGEGAMGVVYRAHDPVIGRPVAIKTVHARLLEGEGEGIEQAADGMAARFRNEARAVGRLSHPGIVAIYEYGEDAGTAFIAMEFVEGKSLAELLRSSPPLPEAEILRLFDQLLDAVGCAHQNGVWHRDIKPANLLVTASGRVKVTDFGIARIENAGLTLINAQIGTPGYMAPEQYSGDSVDHRADLYACGVLLYRLLTGRKPFEGGAASVMFKVMNETPEPPSRVGNGRQVEGYDEIIAKALARLPADRFASAAEFRAALANRLEDALAPGSSITDLPTLVRRIPASSAPAADRAQAGEPTTRGSASKAGAANRTALTALTPTGWDPGLLSPLERALASVVGPMARVMVRNAARQSEHLDGVRDLLAAQLEDAADRARFLARLESGGTLPVRSASSATAPPSAASPGAARQGPSEETLANASRVLARHVGPIARILVKKAAANARDDQGFYESLADLAESVDRAQLLNELRAVR